MTDEPWEPHFEALGSFLRTQRQLANLSLREMARRTKVSNAYLSQIERGLHEPSVRVLGSIARALDLSREVMLAQAGLFEQMMPDAGVPDSAQAPDPDQDPVPTPDSEQRIGPPAETDAAIQADPRLTEEQREALLRVYRSFVNINPQG